MTLETITYKVHPHAKAAVQKRFGILPEHVTNWCNQILSNSVEAYTEYEGRVVYQHRTKEVFLAVDRNDLLVVTVIDKPIEKVKVRSPFLDAMLPQLERELAKMKRDYTRKRRALEKVHAETTLERGYILERRAKACNPDTQANLAREASLVASQIKDIELELHKMKRDYEVSEVKVSQFIRSCQGEKEGYEV